MFVSGDGVAIRRLIAVEDVVASLPKERQKAIAARGAALLAKVERRVTLAGLHRSARPARRNRLLR